MRNEDLHWSRDQYLVSALREDKAAREADTAEGRLAHEGLARLYRTQATSLQRTRGPHPNG